MHTFIPIGLERRATKDHHDRNNQIEDSDHEDRRPHDSEVDAGELEGEQVGADGEFE